MVLGAVLAVGGSAPTRSASVLARQRAEYNAERPKSILELQPFRRERTARLASGGLVQLISLNPTINDWFVLRLARSDNTRRRSFHIENPNPAGQKIVLSADPTPALILTSGGKSSRCAPWSGTPSALSSAHRSRRPFAPICGGRLFLRNREVGATTNLEWTANFLRKHVWGGDLIVGFVKDTFFKDAFSQAAMVVPPAAGPAGNTTALPGLGPAASHHVRVRSRIGLALTGTRNHRMALGRWYPVTGVPGVYASAMVPSALDPAILHGPGKTNPLDRVESHSMDYLVAFDLSQFNLGYVMGTQHPGLEWSPRPPASVRNPALPGPDGVGSPAPLVPLGMIDPVLAPRLVATFTAGFKRRHGAFKGGPFSRVNHGSHYGFIEQGAIMSKLQPGLSTLYVLADGSIHIKTWTLADNAKLQNIRFARQNGVPLLKRNPAGGTGIPGAEVTSWLGGNWSGSADWHLRTLRAGACLKQGGGKRYLVFGYFSTATPSAMARVFEGYGCSYAMHLDMNALVHTYLALYPHVGGKRKIEHLVPGMAVVDRKDRHRHRMARFVDYPDNRDFFYLTRRAPAG
jgi:hypothetical protein